MKKHFIKSLLPAGVAIMLMISLAGCGDSKTVASGATWIVDKTTGMDRLTVEKGAAVTAPEGYSLTLTVDGIGIPVEPGEYRGDVVLTVTEEIIVDYAPPASEGLTHRFKTAVYVDNGRFVPEKSVMAAVIGGEVTDTAARDITITSREERFNGIMVTGDSTSPYIITNPVIDFTGNGGNDFAGFGAAIMSSGNAEVTVDHARITTRGAIRTAVFVGGNSTMRVNDSEIDVYNGTLPEGYTFNVTLGKMMEVPWMLGLTGNCRATNLVESGNAYYNNTSIRAQGWGCLSTDDAKQTRLYATDCVIETVESGYGSYSIGDLNSFSACTFTVKDMALIMAGAGSGTFTDGTTVDSGRFGVVAHSGSRGTLTIDKGSVFNTKATAILIKSSTPAILVEDAELNPENRIILESIKNDDPYVDNPSAIGGPSSSPSAGGMPEGGMPGNGMPGGGNGITALFKNMTLDGDIVNGNTASSGIEITMENTVITGAITTAIAAPAGEPSREKYYLMGEVVNTYCATDGKNGIEVSLDKDSTWIVDRTSYLTGLTIAGGADITAPEGCGVTMTVDGISKPLKQGGYRGRIILTVKKL